MSDLLAQLQPPEPSPIEIPKSAAKKTRVPLLLLIDVSGSTSIDFVNGRNGPNADIHHINKFIGRWLDVLRNPPPESTLADNHQNIDLAIITYSNDVKIALEWTPIMSLPADIPKFVADEETQTGKALLYAMSYAMKQFVAVRNRNVKCGMPNLFHITDGAPTDMEPGTPLWDQVIEHIARLSPNPEKHTFNIKHFVTANGCDPDFSKKLGLPDRPSGLEMMNKLANGDHTYELKDSEKAFHDLIKTFTVLIEHASDLANGVKPANQNNANAASNNIKVH